MHSKRQIASVPLKTLESGTHFYLIFVPSPEPADVQFLLGRRGRTSWNVCSSWLWSCLHPGGPELLLTAALYVLQSSLPWVILQTPAEATTTIWAKWIHTHTSSGYLEALFWDLLVCRGLNENACIASVLKSTGCISAGNFYACTYMYVHGCTHMWTYRNIKLTASNSYNRVLSFKTIKETLKCRLEEDLMVHVHSFPLWLCVATTRPGQPWPFSELLKTTSDEGPTFLWAAFL